MAGLPWFEMDTDFAENPKVKALCARLREPLADAYVARVYAYCYRQVQDRFDSEVAVETLEDAARWRGRRGVLFDALMQVGVLQRDVSKVIVHGVRERLEPHTAKRLADAERQRNRRLKASRSIGRLRDVTPDVAVDVARDSQRDKDKDRDNDILPHARSQQITSAGGRAGESKLGPLGEELVRSVEAGLGHGLVPARNGVAQALEAAIVEWGGVESALAFLASTCRNRDVKPQSVAWLAKVLGKEEGR